jgi:hypothetical protein
VNNLLEDRQTRPEYSNYAFKNINPGYQNLNIDNQLKELDYIEFDRPNSIYKSRMDYEDMKNII